MTELSLVERLRAVALGFDANDMSWVAQDIREAADALAEQAAALVAADRWLSGLVAHAGRCSVHGNPCTCGLEAARAQVRAALAKAAPEKETE